VRVAHTLPARPAVSFLVYEVELLLLFPFNVYNGLNLLLAGGFALQEVLMYRKTHRKRSRADCDLRHANCDGVGHIYYW